MNTVQAIGRTNKRGKILSRDKEIAIARDFHLSKLTQSEIAAKHEVPEYQVSNISFKYEVKSIPEKVEVHILQKDAEFAAFLLSEYQIDFEFANIHIESKINE